MKYFWLLLINLLFPALFFAAGPTILTEGGGGAPTQEVEVEGTEEEAPSEEGESTEEGEATEEEAGKTEEEKTEEKTGKPSVKLDLRTVSPEIRSHIQELGKTNPKLANHLQNALYTSKSFLTEFPGGLKEAQGIKKQVDDLGGFEEISKMGNTFRALEDEQEALDSKARSGDPAVLDVLVETAGSGFSKLMPHALDKWRSQDPEMYSHVMGQTLVAALQEGGVVQNLNLAVKMLALKNEDATKTALEAFQSVIEWVNNVNKIATKAPEKPKADPEMERQRQEVAEGQTKLFNDKFASTFGPWRDHEIRNEVLKHVPAGRKLTPDQIRTLGKEIVGDVQVLLKSDTDYMKNITKLYNARDMDELMKFARNRTLKVLPDVSKKAYRRLFSDFSGGKPAVKKTPEKGKPGVVAGKPAPQGWAKVADTAAPRPDEIDNNATSFAMKFNKQAILKTGKKVYWGTKVPA